MDLNLFYWVYYSTSFFDGFVDAYGRSPSSAGSKAVVDAAWLISKECALCTGINQRPGALPSTGARRMDIFSPFSPVWRRHGDHNDMFMQLFYL